jgi:hypothetical protein
VRRLERVPRAPPAEAAGHLKDGGVFIDVKSAFSPALVERGIKYWSL